jgi:putative ABC transport system permease protein
MLKHYLRVTLRSLRFSKGYAALNVVGLAVGLACALVIGLYVRGELAFDRFHANAARIARVTLETPDGNVVVTPTVLGPMLEREFPEVEETVRLYALGGFRPLIVRSDAATGQEAGFVYADSSAFDVFTFPLVAGDARTALTRPNTVVLTETAARRYFPGGAALGRPLQVNEETYEVTGVMRDLPPASHLAFDFLASFASTHWAQEEQWGSANFLTYVLFRDAAAADAFGPKLDERVAQAQQAGDLPPMLGLALEPLRTIHLDVEGRRRYVVLFAAIAALILLVACVNYMNLATARAVRRAKEVGVRKVTGAFRGQLVAQFYAEAALLTAFSLALAAGLAALLLPALRAATGAPLALDASDPLVPLGLLAVGVVVTLVAGSYPALLLSSFRPVQVLKGQARSGRGATRLRQGLVVFQFAVSVFLLAGTAVVHRQLRYLQTKDLGFRGEQVVALPVGDRPTQEALPALKRALLALPGVEAASAINSVPGEQRGGYSLTAEGLEVPADTYVPIGGVPADADVVEALGLELVAGAGFPPAAHLETYAPDDGHYYYLVNEATLRATGWSAEEAVGKRMSVSGDGRWGTLVGVIRDYHFLPLHEEIRPLALFVEGETNELLVRLAPGDVAGALAAVEATWRRLVPHRPFAYRFLDEAFAAAYASERQLGALFGGFALLAVLIACLGLFGLAAYAAERRTKEIGVRKVLGATARDVVLLLSREYAVLVLVGALVAAPFAYLAVTRWLEGFAYRVPVGPGLFLAAGAAALLLALATVAGQALRAAASDPVKALRYE